MVVREIPALSFSEIKSILGVFANNGFFLVDVYTMQKPNTLLLEPYGAFISYARDRVEIQTTFQFPSLEESLVFIENVLTAYQITSNKILQHYNSGNPIPHDAVITGLKSICTHSKNASLTISSTDYELELRGTNHEVTGDMLGVLSRFPGTIKVLHN